MPPVDEVIDLLSESGEEAGSESDDDADLPAFACLAARLKERREAARGTAVAQTAATRPPAAAGDSTRLGAREPLSVVHNYSADSASGKLVVNEAPFTVFDSPPRPQYHQQEQREQVQSPAIVARRSGGPARGKRVVGSLRSPGAGLLGGSPGGVEDDEEWQPGASQQAPAAKKQRRPRRTREEIERDNAIKAQLREENKELKKAKSKEHALSQVRLLVDSELMSSAGKSAALGVSLLAHLEEHNAQCKADNKRISYSVARLDLAPYKALRWQRRYLVGGAAGAAGAAVAGYGASQQPEAGSQPGGTQASGSGRLEERWEDEPHVMVLFQPQEFIDAVRADRLSSLFSLLERRAPGQRPHLLVVGLASHILAQDRRQAQADVRAGVRAQQQSAQVLVQEFVTSLQVECPRLAFRDVVDAAQAAQHVQLMTAAIAKSHHQDSDATVFLRAHNRGESQSITNLLLDHPVEDRGLEPCLRALAAVPSVKPGIAHALVTNYGSLGGLMDVLLDPARSDRDKEQEIANMGNVGTTRRVGPVAARQLLQLLRSDDPDLRVKEEDKEDKGAGGRARAANK